MVDPSTRRQKAERRGRLAEYSAWLALSLNGWAVIDRRVRTPVGEIDLIARRWNRLAFIEVKYRASHEMALSAVSPAQSHRFLRAGALWLTRHPDLADHARQYDLMAVSPWRWPKRIENAFIAEGRDQERLL